MAPRRRSRRRSSTRSRTPTPTNMPTSIAACTSCPTRRPRSTRRRARPCGASSTPRAPTRSSSPATPPRRSTSSRASYGMDFGEGDEIVLSIMEHHSNIVPWNFHRERKGAVIKWAPVADDGTFLLDEFEKLLTDADEDRRHHPHVERARHGGAGEGGGADRPRPRHPGAGRRQPGGRAPAGRCPRPRLRLLLLHRPQDLRADRHRRALRQARAA